MDPAAQSSEPYNWKASLEDARSAFLRQDKANAAPALFDALGGAAQMARQCYDELLEYSPGPVPPERLKDWFNFLAKLDDYITNVFTTRIDLVGTDSRGRVQAALKDIRDAALSALFAIKFMDKEKSVRMGRQAAAEELRELMIKLETGKERLERLPGFRAIAKTKSIINQPEVVQVPRIGRIAAGQLNIAVEFAEEVFPLPRRLVGTGTFFALEVYGDSMVNAGILNGDFVVVRQQSTVENQEIVVARIDDEATVKRMRRSGGHIWLVPENPVYEEISGDRAVIMGKVVAVLRRT